jgi:hypothetical protein
MNGLTYESVVQTLFTNPKEGREQVKAILRNRDTKIQNPKDVKLLPMDALERLRPEDMVVPPPRSYRPLDVKNGQPNLGDPLASNRNNSDYTFLWGVGIVGGLCALGLYVTSKKD